MASREFSSRRFVYVLATLCLLMMAGNLQTKAQTPPSEHTHPLTRSGAAPEMAAASVVPPDQIAEGGNAYVWCQDTEWSTFNHRVAGWFLFLWGITALIAGLEWPRRTWRRFVPPVVLFGLAEFLFFRNDPETWPTGPVSFWASLHNAEDMQHRIFVALILLMGVVELLRAAERLRPFFAKYALPGLAVLGSVYLFFHHHNGESMVQMWVQPKGSSMMDSAAMQQAMISMKLVMHEHMWFSIFGFGLAATKVLADMGYIKGRWGATLWTLFAIFLGIYMGTYIE